MFWISCCPRDKVSFGDIISLKYYAVDFIALKHMVYVSKYQRYFYLCAFCYACMPYVTFMIAEAYPVGDLISLFNRVAFWS
jgi:hypothetical protein